MQFFSGAAEVQRLCDGNKIAQMAQFDMTEFVIHTLNISIEIINI